MRAGRSPRLGLRLFAPLLAVLVASWVQAAGPSVRFQNVTDVTPRGFRVMWLASEPSAPDLRLYLGPDCTDEIPNVTTTPFPLISGNTAIVAEARQKGVMLVGASNLEPDTDYCVRTVTTSLWTGETIVAPTEPLHVRTRKATKRHRVVGGVGPATAFSNDLLRIVIEPAPSGQSGVGMLVGLKVSGAASPLTAFVGDGVGAGGGTTAFAALFDLNNLYDPMSGESLALRADGTEIVSVVLLGGPQSGVTVHARLVPQNTHLNAVVVPEGCAGAPQTACDGGLGDATFNGVVTLADADAVRDHVVDLTPILPCNVCADVTWDLRIDITDALAIGQVVSGLRSLPW